jgi:hypothetical protein
MNVNELEPLSELVDAVEAYHKAIYRTAIDPHTLSAARAALESLSRAGQEPVAWQRRAVIPGAGYVGEWNQCFDMVTTGPLPGFEYRPIYTHPPDTSAIRRQALEDGLRHAAGELLTHIDKYHDYEGDTPASANLRYIYHHLLGCLTYGEGNSLATAGGQND